MKTINFDEWVSEYKPIQNPFTEHGSYDNMGFETYGQEVEYVVNHYNTINKKQIWTLLNCENEESWIVPGYLLVNRMFYFITEKEWESEDIEVNDNEMITVLDAMQHCWKFAESQNIQLSMNNLSDFFTSNTDKELEITVGKAKYLAIEFIENHLDNELSEEQQDLIHNYYSNI